MRKEDIEAHENLKKRKISNGKNVAIEQRRARVLELRVSGLSLTQIAEVIKNDYGEFVGVYGKNSVHDDLMAILNRSVKMSDELGRAYRELELEKLDGLWMAMYSKALQGNEKAAMVCLRIIERRSKFLGLDAPSQVKVRDWRSEIIELIQNGKITLETARQELGEELYLQLIESRGDSIIEGGFVDREVEEGSPKELPSGTE